MRGIPSTRRFPGRSATVRHCCRGAICRTLPSRSLRRRELRLLSSPIGSGRQLRRRREPSGFLNEGRSARSSEPTDLARALRVETLVERKPKRLRCFDTALGHFRALGHQSVQGRRRDRGGEGGDARRLSRGPPPRPEARPQVARVRLADRPLQRGRSGAPRPSLYRAAFSVVDGGPGQRREWWRGETASVWRRRDFT